MLFYTVGAPSCFYLISDSIYCKLHHTVRPDLLAVSHAPNSPHSFFEYNHSELVPTIITNDLWFWLVATFRRFILPYCNNNPWGRLSASLLFSQDLRYVRFFKKYIHMCSSKSASEIDVQIRSTKWVIMYRTLQLTVEYIQDTWSARAVILNQSKSI